MQGVKVLEDFDLNIYDPSSPSTSPHWTSPASGHTYCSKWILEIGGTPYTVTAINPGSEVNLVGSYFFEGETTVSDAKGNRVGHLFMEQMGYN